MKVLISGTKDKTIVFTIFVCFSVFVRDNRRSGLTHLDEVIYYMYAVVNFN